VLHFHHIGHFDPRDFVDLSSIPHKPKVQRPLSRAAVDRILATFDGAVAEYVWYDESGYVGCSWTQTRAGCGTRSIASRWPSPKAKMRL
jgi:hypothetical protein